MSEDWAAAIDDLLDGIIDECVPPPPPDGSFTVRQYHARLAERGIEISLTCAERQLQKQVKHGALLTALAFVDKRHQRVYWKRAST